MARDQGEFQRARRPEQKQQRQAAILQAARDLGLREGVRNISLADIAAEIGMHKTALLRYFETREEIYLRLAADDWGNWAAAMRAELKPFPPDAVKEVAETFARTLDERPLFCDLLTHASLNLERNVSVESVLQYKLAALAALTDVSRAVRMVLPDLTEQDAQDIVMGVAAIAAGLWQITHPPPNLAQLYLENPAVAHGYGYVNFVPTITRLTETFVLGLRARH